MDIIRLLGGPFGTKETENVKLVELKVGQVVRGIVLQMLSEQDALVNIAGTPVRARLETPMPQGRATLLQVQPQSTSGQIVLKPLTDSGVPIVEQSVATIAKSLGMSDTETNRVMLKELHAAGIPLEAMTIRPFQSALNSLSQAENLTGATAEQWTQSSIVAYKKGLPLKTDIILSLHQVLFGKSAASLTAELDRALQTYLSDPVPTESDRSSSAILAQKLRSSLDQWIQALRRPFDLPEASASARHQATATSQTTTEHSAAPAAALNVVNRLASAAAVPVQAGASSAEGLAKTTTEAAKTMSTANEAGSSVADETKESTAVPHTDKNQVQKGPDDSFHLAAARKEPWIRALFRHLGLDYEFKALESISAPLSETNSPDPVKDSIKGLILQLSGDESLPPALKESLQQSLLHITGQQLLLGGDKGTPISILTMVIPIGEQGAGSDQAAVQIQARRNKSGCLDSENCRLLFDLHMRHMGNTLVDVQVSNRIVSLQVHNDHPLIAGLLETAKPEIEAALSNIGYQFVSLRHLSYPVRSGEDQSVGNNRHSSISAAASALRSYQYKGVDMRV